MKEHDDTPRPGSDDDHDLRSLMRDSDYSGRLRDEFKRDLLRELNHNFRYHRLQSRSLVVAVVVLAAGALLWRASDVGSDGFDLVPTGQKVNGNNVVEAPLSGMRFNTVPSEGDTDGGLAATRGVYSQLVAGDAKLLGFESWTIDGQTTQVQRLEVLRNGQPEQLVQASGGSKNFHRSWKQLRKGLLAADLAAIEAGRLAPQRTETIRMRGQDFTVGVWSWDTPTDGRVTYKRSLPVADLP